jgi:protein-tyrosine phosphatase
MQADVHFHLLPGVDDGPLDLDDALALARAPVDDGTRVVVATPHVSVVDVAQLPSRVAAMREALDENGIELDVRCGGELNVHDVDGCTDADLQTLAVGRGWQLLETPFRALGPLHRVADELRDRGYWILLAHPERCHALWEDDEAALRRELSRGAWAQVSGGSVLGINGGGARARALHILRDHPDRTLVASDAHSTARPPVLRAAREALRAEGLPAALVQQLVVEAPMAVVEGEP